MAIKKKPICAAMLLTPFALIPGGVWAQNDDVDQRIEDLERQVQELKNQTEANRAQTSANKQANEAQVEEFDASRVTTKGTTFSYGGYIKLDTIFSNYSEGKPSKSLEDFMIPSAIPVESGQDSWQSLNMHAKESRFNFGTVTNTDIGTIKSFFELDFMLPSGGDERVSSSFNPRLRHAFVRWQFSEKSYFLAGQTWSAFMNVGALPDQLDFVGPVATIFERQPMLQWGFGGFKISLENPYTRLNAYDGVTGEKDDNTVKSDSETIPDIILRYDGKAGGLAWSVAGIGRQLSYDYSGAANPEFDDDNSFGYGLNFAFVWKVLTRDDIRFSISGGDALGRYMGLNSFNDGYIDDDGKIKGIKQVGGFLAYRHFWNDRWRSSFSLSASQADNPDTDDAPDADNWAKAYRSAHANLNYMPYPTLQIGGELIYGYKELEDGRDGNLKRFQFSVKYAF